MKKRKTNPDSFLDILTPKELARFTQTGQFPKRLNRLVEQLMQRVIWRLATIGEHSLDANLEIMRLAGLKMHKRSG
jgi:hypothetical protein